MDPLDFWGLVSFVSFCSAFFFVMMVWASGELKRINQRHEFNTRLTAAGPDAPTSIPTGPVSATKEGLLMVGMMTSGVSGVVCDRCGRYVPEEETSPIELVSHGELLAKALCADRDRCDAEIARKAFDADMERIDAPRCRNCGETNPQWWLWCEDCVRMGAKVATAEALATIGIKLAVFWLS